MNAPAAPTLSLNTGITMPRLGFGTWPLEDIAAERAVITAIHAGYRLIDTASSYGNEDAVGRAIRHSGLPREDAFVTTKLHGEDHGFNATLRAFDASLDELKLDYLDLYLIHWPLPSRDLYVDTWRAFGKLRDEGRVRAIGVSNFKPAHIDRLISETGIMPSVNQIQLHPQTTQPELRAYHEFKGIVTESWSPLDRSSGLLSTPVIRDLAANYGKSPAQIVLRWHIELGLATIPNSSRQSRIQRNIDIFDFSLTPAEVRAISALDRGNRPPVDSDVTQPGLQG
ncbi:aldo/keto reductase [Streptomyces scabiei]|jgi:2,5-diketo-D-gluconate reductase A|uniref:aldo/keto reductase n=1 Tax=Streptomyces scabiei TaxID=1930 RepID=UPI002FF1F5DE